jgi:hypothetical protein
LIKALTGEEMRLVVTHTSYPVVDSATSLYDWYNAKVGPKAVVDSGAFVNVMTRLGLAEVVENKLEWKGKEGKKVKLTFVRNEPSDEFKLAFNDKNSEKMNFEELKEFFNMHVKVVPLDASCWENYRKNLVRTSQLSIEYHAILEANGYDLRQATDFDSKIPDNPA